MVAALMRWFFRPLELVQVQGYGSPLLPAILLIDAAGRTVIGCCR